MNAESHRHCHGRGRSCGDRDRAGHTGQPAAGARGGDGTKFDNGGRVKLKVKGSVELISQKITAQPGATFGWHNHPGENFNVIWQGTLTLYHDEACATGIDYAPGSAFSTHPQDIHLAKNTVDVVFFATYLAPKTTPPTLVRVDQPLPAAGCPQ